MGLSDGVAHPLPPLQGFLLSDGYAQLQLEGQICAGNTVRMLLCLSSYMERLERPFAVLPEFLEVSGIMGVTPPDGRAGHWPSSCFPAYEAPSSCQRSFSVSCTVNFVPLTNP